MSIFRLISTIFCILMTSVFSSTASGATKDCFSCAPQCVPSAREWSGVDVPRVKTAADIPASMKGKSKFKTSNEPAAHSLAVIALGPVDHAIAIIQAVKNKKSKSWVLVVSHSNADCKCSSETVKATFTNGLVTFTSGMLKKKTYKVRAFISNR